MRELQFADEIDPVAWLQSNSLATPSLVPPVVHSTVIRRVAVIARDTATLRDAQPGQSVKVTAYVVDDVSQVIASPADPQLGHAVIWFTILASDLPPCEADPG